MRTGRWLAVVAGAVGVAVIVLLVVVIGAADSPPSGQEALQRAKRFVNDAESVEYHAEDRTEYFDVPPDEEPVERSTIVDAAVFPDRSRSVYTYEDVVYETVTIDGASYTRTAEAEDELDETQWLSTELLAEDAPLSGEFIIGVSGAVVSPEELPALIETARRPRIVGRGDGTTVIRARLDLLDFETYSFFIEPRMDLVVRDEDGRPVAMRLFEEDEFTSQATAIEFDHWNTDVAIDEPVGSDLDPTPAFNEEGIAAYDDVPLYQPRTVPEGWILESASFVLGGESVEDCDQVLLALVDTEGDVGVGYLDLYLLPESCSLGEPPEADDFTAGGTSGWSVNEEGYVYGEIVVGETLIQFDTDLDEDDLAELLADLVPLDLENPPVSTVSFA